MPESRKIHGCFWYVRMETVESGLRIWKGSSRPRKSSQMSSTFLEVALTKRTEHAGSDSSRKEKWTPGTELATSAGASAAGAATSEEDEEAEDEGDEGGRRGGGDVLYATHATGLLRGGPAEAES